MPRRGIDNKLRLLVGDEPVKTGPKTFSDEEWEAARRAGTKDYMAFPPAGHPSWAEPGKWDPYSNPPRRIQK